MELAILLSLAFVAAMIFVTIATLVVLHFVIIKEFDMKLHLLSNRLFKVLITLVMLVVLLALVLLGYYKGVETGLGYLVGLCFGSLFVVGYWKKASGKW